ncbi:MAG: hypothetical protein IH945_02115 [Armatimonadetes bacterium]|nr:hypothetical protein [Armatimonadota bacterium]
MKHRPNARTADIAVENHGSIFTFAGLTDAGRGWLAENVDARGEAGYPIYCEHRFAYGIAEGAQSDGLTLV